MQRVIRTSAAPRRATCLLSSTLASLALVSISACAHYTPRPVSPGAMLDEFQHRTLDSPGIRAFLDSTGTGTGWWDADALVNVALYYHPRIPEMRARWEAARSAMGVAGQLTNPTLEVSPGFNASNGQGNVSSGLLPVNLILPLVVGSQRDARVRRAAHEARSAWWDIASAAWEVRAGVLESVLDLEAAQEAERLLAERHEASSALAQILRDRLQAGDATRLEAARSLTAVRESELERLSFVQQARQSRVRLASTIGVPSLALDSVELVFPALDQATGQVGSSSARRRALTQRSDILAALERYGAAEEALRFEVARQFPTLSLGPGYEFDQGDNKWSLSLGFTLPLLNRNQAAIAEARMKRAAEAARFQSLQARVLASIDEALVVYDSELGRTRATEELQDLAETRERQMHARKEIGDVSRVEVLASRIETLDARRATLEARIRRLRAYFALEHLLEEPDRIPASFAPSIAVPRGDIDP